MHFTFLLLVAFRFGFISDAVGTRDALLLCLQMLLV